MATRVLPLASADAFALVTDLSRHGQWIPLTRVDAPARPARVGDAVVARSAGFFVDRMVVERADPPVTETGDGTDERVGDGVGERAGDRVDDRAGERSGEPATGRPGVAVLRKLGPVLLGTATIAVVPVGARAARVRWTEDVWLRGPLPEPVTRAVLAPFLDAMTALALRRIDRSLRRWG